ncbi:MAG: RluA family pseudouridine synthase [Bacteroidota bacterium]
MNIHVLHEDNHLIAVYKPAGVLVQGDATGDSTLADWVKRYIKDRYNKPGDVFLGIIHRLDRPVSGVVIFARTSKALSRMNELFRERKIEKTYWAITSGRPEKLEGELIHYLLKDTAKNKAKAYDKPSRRNAKAKKAELRYKTIGVLGDHAVLAVYPKTGRPHQIRVQLAKMGNIIKGDVKYGADRPNEDASIYLHCHQMSFIHPVKKEPVSIKVKAPDLQMWREFGLTDTKAN